MPTRKGITNYKLQFTNYKLQIEKFGALSRAGERKDARARHTPKPFATVFMEIKPKTAKKVAYPVVAAVAAAAALSACQQQRQWDYSEIHGDFIFTIQGLLMKDVLSSEGARQSSEENPKKNLNEEAPGSVRHSD